jgi:hypothetical protein
MYCEYLLFLTYSKENLNAETLSTLSKLAVHAEEILIEMDGEGYAVNIKIRNLFCLHKTSFLVINKYHIVLSFV